MSYSIMQILSLFQENEDHDIHNIGRLSDSEPITPAFKDEKEQLVRQINEFRQQNQILQNECQKQIMNLSEKLSRSQILQSEIEQYKEQIRGELNQSQILTKQFLQKHESCFNLKQRILQQKNYHKLHYENPGKRITTCPSETSTVQSSSFVIPLSPQLKKLHYNSFNHHF
ncbi:unnamed protein product (macronuclear) [Paramecium tetraurelia]|uniref:Uncharacterized protein n=1 Tax=Paramecium tetraurelia TaxID=5888 RepID=A0DU49_PARTE|nr:uncharacterized protein GSPATT00020237001 [Paramecium tetraurelia]CAK86566.1 unnamed protein product [Paramecium tetraurelia]|eukprot:XP_001453963.1 hypothetical protein (macronuclear) [Paramecium tetraurelia strain d4-2]